MDEQQVEDIVKCKIVEVGNLTRDETRGEVVCDDCGLVLEDNVIDQGAEWRYSHQNKETRELEQELL